MNSRWDIYLNRKRLKGRTFLLGNTRAFSLALPAASGLTDAHLHPHKWFGAYLYGRKFLEAQVVRAGTCTRDLDSHLLNRRFQTGFTMELAEARREYEIDGKPCAERFFVADGIDGFACTLTGDLNFSIEPQFDLRFYRALNRSVDGYATEPIEHGCIVSKPLPSGAYDDRSETFMPDGVEDQQALFAAVQVVADGSDCEFLPPEECIRQKTFTRDKHRRQFVEYRIEGEDVGDHAPLWLDSESTVYAPVRLSFRGPGVVIYGFGATRDEALTALHTLRDQLADLQREKTHALDRTLQRSKFETGCDDVDIAYAQVLARLMSALVARNALPADSALERTATMILAGNGYFHDAWKRDENIALGFLLSLGYYDLARDVIRDTWQLQDERTGRLPQRIRAGETPPYHSSDGTLWALWRLHEYWRCTGDETLLQEKLPMVRRFFERSLESTVRGLLPSGRTTDPNYLWETWMDTPHTPRHGFPVEIQMLWLAVLRAFRPILRDRSPELEAAMRWAEMTAHDALKRFFVRGMPADGLDEDGVARDLITPNPYFCFEVGLDLGPVVEWTMRHIGRSQLAGAQGIVTLAPQDWPRVFPAEFLSDARNVRGGRMRSVGKFNYHRGVEWNWLAQFFVQGELKYGETDVAFHTYLSAQVQAALQRGGIGGISELFDLSGTRGPEFQAWSMSGLLEGIQAFAGVKIDVPGRHISLEPQLPANWPHITARKWYGATPFDLTYTRREGAQYLDIAFPECVPQDANIEIALLLQDGRTATAVTTVTNGVPCIPPWRVEPIAGATRSRVRFTVSVAASVRIEVQEQGELLPQECQTA
jgi:glycogen debranching enzyme